MKIKVKRIDKSIPLPKFESSGAVGLDFLSRESMIIPSKEIALIPSNLIVEVPKGYALILAPRSSTPKKTGLTFPHSVGVIDQDFCGEGDEIMIQVYNFTENKVEIKKGDRIAQGLFVKVEDQIEWQEVDTHDKPTRGSFGSTD